MIMRNRGDGDFYEAASSNLSLTRARVDFINAISEFVPSIFEALHDKPKKAYEESGLLNLRRKRRAEFWSICYGGAEKSFYFTGFPGLTAHIKQDELEPQNGNERELLRFNEYAFLADFGLNYRNQKDCEYYLAEIKPNLTTWFNALEQWGRDSHLSDGWLLHWAFLKIDTYLDPDPRPYDDPIYRELNPQLFDIFGRDIQPPKFEITQPLKFDQHDFWVEPFEFKSDIWRCLVVTPEDFQKQIREDFDIRLTRYFTNIKRYLELRPDISTRKEGAQPQDYEWLARFQCDKKSMASLARIAGEVDQSQRQRVMATIHQLANWIGLTLRHEKGGRPIGSKPKHVAQKGVNKGKNQKLTG